jgi:hypothetical protein
MHVYVDLPNAANHLLPQQELSMVCDRMRMCHMELGNTKAALSSAREVHRICCTLGSLHIEVTVKAAEVVKELERAQGL